MSVVFLIPGPLRAFTNGRSEVAVEGSFATLREALAVLCAMCPGLRDRMLTEQGEVREHINLFVGKECVRFGAGLATRIPDRSEISIIPAISGGASEGLV